MTLVRTDMKIFKVFCQVSRCPKCGREEVPGWGDCDCYNHPS
ncbi:hypothetical protein [Pseudomonas phage K4]|nr:hypothetical protein [Pseudomonas phage K4]